MDYMTKPASRQLLRVYAFYLRKLFGCTDINAPFDVLTALEMIASILPGTTVEIVEDNELPQNVPARCFPDSYGNFTITIKESVYNGAYSQQIGAYLGFMCHEICHVFLYKIGYTPVFSRSFKNNYVPAYRSVEWQTKALCGEVMMPYEATKNMTEREIMEKYHVSFGFAQKRKTY